MLLRESSHPGLSKMKCAAALFCCAISLVLAGCTTPSVVTTYEYHHRYDRMSDRYDPPVSLVHIEPGADLGAYQVIVVGEFTVGREWVNDPEKASHYGNTYLRQVLAKELLESGHFYVSLDPFFRPALPTAVLEGKITVFDTGSGLSRFLSPYLFFIQSASAVDLQLEGRLRDAHSGDILLEFADRRQFLGRTPWGPTLKTFNDDWSMKQTIILTSASLVELISYLQSGIE